MELKRSAEFVLKEIADGFECIRAARWAAGRPDGEVAVVNVLLSAIEVHKRHCRILRMGSVA